MRKAKKSRQPKTLTFFCWVFLILLIGSIGYILYEALQIGIFTSTQLMIAGGVLALIGVLFACLLIKRFYHVWTKILVFILSGAFSLICMYGGYYIDKTNDLFSLVVTNPNSDSNSGDTQVLNSADVLGQMAMTVTTYAMHGSNITNPGDLNGKVVGVMMSADEKGTTGAINQLNNAGATFETREYPSSFSLVDALYANEVDAIILPEQFHDELLENANDFNKYNALTTFTNNVDQYIYYEPIPEEMRNPADEVADITKDPFTILISGADSYGNINSANRSDVNMLVTVNPVTHQVLMVSLPRDSYIPFSCKKNINACYNISGQQDKLTHTGFYGVGTTESTLEDFLGVEINYTVQVNFSSLINIVDAIGGIDVEVEPGLEVETFYANGTEGVHAGTNHLEGERALAFARERHAYLTGDNQRIINQQLVLKALLNKMMSPAMVVNYPGFIRALSTAFSTNMPTKQIKELIGLELAGFPSWNIQSFTVSGDSDMLYCPSLNAVASVVIDNQAQVEQASSLIQDVIEGKEIDVNNPSSEPNVHRNSSSDQTTDTDPSQDQIDNSSDYPYPGYTDPGYTDPGYIDPGYTDPGYQNPSYTDPGYTDPGYIPGEDMAPVAPQEPELPSFPVDTPDFDLPFEEYDN